VGYSYSIYEGYKLVKRNKLTLLGNEHEMFSTEENEIVVCRSFSTV